MKTKKSYNKLPRLVPRIAAYALAFEAALAALVAAAPEAPHLVARTIVQIAKTVSPSKVIVDDGAVVVAAALAALACAMALAWRDVASFHNGAWLGEKPSPSAAEGTARLVSRPAELKRAFDVWEEGETPAPGVVVGGIGSDGGKLLLDTGEMSLLLLGGSGSGKTSTVLLPTLAGFIESGTSFAALDPKRELADITGAYAEKKGMRWIEINFADPELSDQWNPLKPAVDCVKGLNGLDASKLLGEVRVIANALIPEEKGSASIWTKGPRELAMGIIGYVVTSKSVSDSACSLSTCAAIAALPQGELKALAEDMPENSDLRRSLESAVNAPAETFGGFAVHVSTTLSAYADGFISRMLQGPGFDLADLAKGKTALYYRLRQLFNRI